MPPVTYAARTGVEGEERRRARNTWVRVHASLQPLFLGENDAAAEKVMPCCCDTPHLPPPHCVCTGYVVSDVLRQPYRTNAPEKRRLYYTDLANSFSSSCPHNPPQTLHLPLPLVPADVLLLMSVNPRPNSWCRLR